ncbi:MAG: hypothetical protein WA636_04785, partial [Methylovirgula sp.]
RYRLSDKARIGDHICYISDLSKVKSHFPDWQMQYNIRANIASIVRQQHDLKPRLTEFTSS